MKREGNSPDGYVRIPTNALPGIELRHLISERDPSIAVPAGATISGFTEWVGTWKNQTVSVGWDWAVVENIIVLVSPNEIRTNIQLIAPHGGPERPQIQQIHLLHWIEALPWREVAINDLIADGSGPRNPH